PALRPGLLESQSDWALALIYELNRLNRRQYNAAATAEQYVVGFQSILRSVFVKNEYKSC
ncbi:MAG: hypothetical protein ACNA7V_12875, partial [Bacteroidales bacterium]